jgi:hypothetical protein
VSEASTEIASEADTAAGAVQAREAGHPLVDQVLASLDGVEQQPVADHVAVFESAHLRLREALSDPHAG